MPIPDGGIYLRAKLPCTVTLCAFTYKVPGCRYAHPAALEDEPFLPWTSVAVLPQRGCQLGHPQGRGNKALHPTRGTATSAKYNSTAPLGPSPEVSQVTVFNLCLYQVGKGQKSWELTACLPCPQWKEQERSVWSLLILAPVSTLGLGASPLGAGSDTSLAHRPSRPPPLAV